MASSRRFTAVDLVPGQVYRVVVPFQDYDGLTHAAGECWRFVAQSFLPYEDGLTLTVDREGKTGVIRLQWRPETQAQIIDDFCDFVDEI
jgi:hypothetical protein